MSKILIKNRKKPVVNSKEFVKNLRSFERNNGLCFNMTYLCRNAFFAKEHKNYNDYIDWFKTFAERNKLVEKKHYQHTWCGIFVTGPVIINIFLRSKTIYGKIARNVMRTTWLDLSEA